MIDLILILSFGLAAIATFVGAVVFFRDVAREKRRRSQVPALNLTKSNGVVYGLYIAGQFAQKHHTFEVGAIEVKGALEPHPQRYCDVAP